MSNGKVKMQNMKGFGLLRQTMVITLGLFLALVLAGCGNASPPAPKPVDPGEKMIRSFVQATNDKDTEAVALGVEASPREYFYQEDSGKVILLKEGMWFVINDDYKNVTPKSSSMFGEAEKFRMKLKQQSKKQ